jgi:hypothetical protein
MQRKISLKNELTPKSGTKMKFLGKIFSKSEASEKTKKPLPSAVDIWGEFPEGTVFPVMQKTIQASFDNDSHSYPIDLPESVRTPKDHRPDYGGMCGFYAFSQLHNWTDGEYLNLLVPQNSDADEHQRLKRLAITALFCEYGAYQMYLLVPDSGQEFSDFAERFRLSLISTFFMLENDQERKERQAEMYLTFFNEFKKSLAGDQRAETKQFLEQIGKTFLASIPGVNNLSAATTVSINKHMGKLFQVFKNGLLAKDHN